MNDIRIVRLAVGPLAVSASLARTDGGAYLTMGFCFFKLTFHFCIGALD